MKSFVILVVLLSGFYVGITKIILSEAKDLENFYANTDQIAASVAEGKDITPYTQSLQHLRSSYNFTVGH